jgi:hypothetical protein
LFSLVFDEDLLNRPPRKLPVTRLPRLSSGGGSSICEALVVTLAIFGADPAVSLLCRPGPARGLGTAGWVLARAEWRLWMEGAIDCDVPGLGCGCSSCWFEEERPKSLPVMAERRLLEVFWLLMLPSGSLALLMVELRESAGRPRLEDPVGTPKKDRRLS